MARTDTATTTFYYPIMYPYSLDLDKDLRDPSTPAGHFAKLTNIIPKGQVLRTRFGVTELAHVPDTN